MSSIRLLSRRFALRVGVIQLTLVCGLVLVLGDAAWIHGAYRKNLEVAGSDVANLSRGLAQHAQDTVQIADTVLTDLQERIAADGLGPPAIARLRRLMVDRMSQVSRVHALFVFDAEGDWVVTSVGSLPRSVNYADRAYFQYHRSHADPAPLIGPPVRSKSDGSWIITVSRRLAGADGGFGGIALATLSVRFFSDFYETFDVGEGGIISLLRGDGVLLARKPHQEELLGRNLSRSAIFDSYLRHEPGPSFEYTAVLDGVRRVGSYRAVDGYPLVVVVARSKAQVLARWRRETAVNLSGLTLVLVTVGALAFRLSRQVRARAQTETDLREANARLLAAEAVTSEANRRLQMAEQIAQVGHWRVGVPDFHLTWSDGVYRIHGLSKDRFAPTVSAAIAAYHPDDREVIRHAFDDLVATRRDFQVCARIIRPDGELRHVLARGVAQVDSDGELRAVFGVFMDTTEQKHAEAQLVQAHAAAEAASRALRELALQDSLTGLANRRQLDAALDMEVRRARRVGGCVALIMIDVDYFKQFNDLYGHPAGDSALRSLAEIIQTTLHRAGDIAARYGGEEMAVLLPDADIPGALAIANEIAEAIRLRAIAHCGSPTTVVTISAGVAALSPAEADDSPEILVRRADAALYRAKQTGRDRVCTADGPIAAPAQLELAR